MDTVLMCIPLQDNCLEQYITFMNESFQHKESEWKEMLKRYDIHSAAIWHKKIAGKDHVFVQHDVGPTFYEKMKDWETSSHPFDQWFNQNLKELYDMGAVEGGATPILNFIV